MFGIQLTLFQKLEVAFICIVLGVAGFLGYKYLFQADFDRTIASFNLPIRHHPVMDTDGRGRQLQVTATNPADPKKDE